MKTSYDIEHEIAGLQKELEAAREAERGPWPRQVEVYLHGDDNKLYDLGGRIGLREQACSCFSHTLDEIAITLSVQQDGTACIVTVGGVKL